MQQAIRCGRPARIVRQAAASICCASTSGWKCAGSLLTAISISGMPRGRSTTSAASSALACSHPAPQRAAHQHGVPVLADRQGRRQKRRQRDGDAWQASCNKDCRAIFRIFTVDRTSTQDSNRTFAEAVFLFRGKEGALLAAAPLWAFHHGYDQGTIFVRLIFLLKNIYQCLIDRSIGFGILSVACCDSRGQAQSPGEAL